ncbi:MAG TPA: hypothetical protein VFG59_06785 [Anaeromyxobacter sp.]|nr:hypothetical protein [Anaeromyxobacter sp.]
MRAVLGALLAAALVASAASPHVHTAAAGDHDCPACLARTVEAAHDSTPDVVPTRVRFLVLVKEPTEVVPVGAPLGAIPGQSPPA